MYVKWVIINFFLGGGEGVGTVFKVLGYKLEVRGFVPSR